MITCQSQIGTTKRVWSLITPNANIWPSINKYMHVMAQYLWVVPVRYGCQDAVAVGTGAQSSKQGHCFLDIMG